MRFIFITAMCTWLLLAQGCILPVMPDSKTEAVIRFQTEPDIADRIRVLEQECESKTLSIDFIPSQLREVVRYTCKGGVVEVTSINGVVDDIKIIEGAR